MQLAEERTELDRRMRRDVISNCRGARAGRGQCIVGCFSSLNAIGSRGSPNSQAVSPLRSSRGPLLSDTRFAPLRDHVWRCCGRLQLFELDGIVARAQKQSYCCVNLRSVRRFLQY